MIVIVIFWAGLRLEEIEGAEVWHRDVRVFSLFDLGSSELVGYCYLDLFSRLSFFNYLKFSCSINFCLLVKVEMGFVLFIFTGKENMVILVWCLSRTMH